jgi:4-diphosphocytidyl-2-C-methyl-D-erythritol kinase
MIIETAPAKFNMFLAVLGRQSDGYHILEHVTAVLHNWPSLHDQLTAEIAQSTTLEIEGPTSNGIFSDESNLVLKAWRALEKEAGRPLPAKIKLHKRIPHSAGLGGGSSDAAAALRAGNSMYQLGLSDSALLRLAAGLGSDVPLFILGGTALCLDKGQRVFPLKDIPLPPMLIACPGEYVSTQSVYEAMRKEGIYDDPPCPSLAPGQPPPWYNGLANAALKVCPALASVLSALEGVGGSPLLCGSGSSMAAKFATEAQRDEAIKELVPKYPSWSIHAPKLSMPASGMK